MGKRIKKVLITTGLVTMIALSTALTGCAKEPTVETMSTEVMTSTEAYNDLNISTVPTSVSKELAEQASREIEEMDELEASGNVVYSETSGDIIHVYSEEEQKINNEFIESIKQDAVNGDLTEDMINSNVDIWFDFMSAGDREELRKELILLLPAEQVVEKEVVGKKPAETKPSEKSAETKSQKPVEKPVETKSATEPVETKPAVQEPVVQEPVPTQQAPVETQPAPTQPAVQEPVPDTSHYTTPGKINFDDTPLDTESHLTPEQIKAINEVEFN